MENLGSLGRAMAPVSSGRHVAELGAEDALRTVEPPVQKGLQRLWDAFSRWFTDDSQLEKYVFIYIYINALYDVICIYL